jgi:hypothetical protein
MRYECIGLVGTEFSVFFFFQLFSWATCFALWCFLALLKESFYHLALFFSISLFSQGYDYGVFAQRQLFVPRTLVYFFFFTFTSFHIKIWIPPQHLNTKVLCFFFLLLLGHLGEFLAFFFFLHSL